MTRHRIRDGVRVIAAVLITLAISDPAAAGDRAVVRGRIDKIDTAANRVTVQTLGGEDITLLADAQSQLTDQGKKTTLDKYVPGLRVRATYTKAGDANRLISLRTAVPSDADLPGDIRAAIDSVREYTFSQKEKYEEKLRAVVEDVDDRIDDLRARAKETTAEARANLKERIDELQRKRDEFVRRLDRAKPAAADAWEEVKSGVAAAAVDLGKAIDALRSDK